jgi:hypothetical protein
MPFVNIDVLMDVFTPAQKEDLIAKLTEAMIPMEGENTRRGPGFASTSSKVETGPSAASRFEPRASTHSP